MPAAPSYVLQSCVNIIKSRVPFFILHLIDASYSLWSRFFKKVFGKLRIRGHIEPSTAAATTRNDAPESADQGKLGEDGDDASIRAADLRLDMIEKILHCISPLESARFPFVCKSWAAIVSPRLASYPLFPHLFVTETVPRSPAPGNPKWDFYLRGYMVSVPLDGGARLPSPAIISAPKLLEDLITRCSAKLIGATPDGRLALAMSKRVIFINPVTDESKTLDVTSVPVCTGIADDSSDTVLSHDYQTYYYREKTRLYRREHGSEEWSCGAVRDATHHSSGISSVANCGVVVFVLYRDGRMAKIDTIARPALVIEAIAPVYEPRPAWRREDEDPQSSRDYLLESDGNVLFVRQQLLSQKPKMFPDDYWHYDTVGFEVHRLDEIGRRWVKVKTLDGDRALFISARSSFSVRASATAGCMRNCIYFVGESHHVGSCREREDCTSTWGVYSMEQKKVLFEQAVVVTERRTVARWFRPNVVWPSHEWE